MEANAIHELCMSLRENRCEGLWDLYLSVKTISQNIITLLITIFVFVSMYFYRTNYQSPGEIV